MTVTTFDPEQYKQAQRQDWGAVAAGWRQWWKTIEQGAQPVSDRLVDLAEIQAGQRVLDVATGIGEPAITAAVRVGLNGHVVATDHAPEMLAIAKERAAELRLKNIEFREMDAEQLDLPEHSFKAVLCRWGLMFLPNLQASLINLRRLLVPGGRLAAAVWGPPAKVPLIALAMNTVRQQLEASPPPPGTLGPFSLADVTQLEQALRNAGFSDIHNVRMTGTLEFSSSEEYTKFHQAVSAPIKAMLANLPAQRQEQVWRAVTDAALSHADVRGKVRLENEVICVAARA